MYCINNCILFSATENVLELIKKMEATEDINNILYGDGDADVYWAIINGAHWPITKPITKADVPLLLQMIIENEVVMSRKFEIDQFADGLHAVGLLDQVRRNRQLCEALFTHSSNNQLTPDVFIKLLVKNARPTAFADRQSYDWLMQFIKDSEEKMLHGLLQFITGFKRVPPLGLPHDICLKYLSEEDESATLPKSIACLCILNLPTVHSSKAKFDNSLMLAIDCESQGFGSV